MATGPSPARAAVAPADFSADPYSLERFTLYETRAVSSFVACIRTFGLEISGLGFLFLRLGAS